MDLFCHRGVCADVQNDRRQHHPRGHHRAPCAAGKDLFPADAADRRMGDGHQDHVVCILTGGQSGGLGERRQLLHFPAAVGGHGAGDHADQQRSARQCTGKRGGDQRDVFGQQRQRVSHCVAPRGHPFQARHGATGSHQQRRLLAGGETDCLHGQAEHGCRYADV